MSITPQMKQLDKLFQRLSQGKKCLYCPKAAQMKHHVVRRENKLTRWIPDNGQDVCQGCHNGIHNGTIQEKMIPAYVWVLAKQGDYRSILIEKGVTEREYLYKLKVSLENLIKNDDAIYWGFA